MPRNIVKCKDCGYLSRVDTDKQATGDIGPDYFPSKEMDLPWRQPDFRIFYYRPIRCHVGKANLDEELRGSHINPTPGTSELASPLKWYEVINKDRECDGFTPYMQGLSPDEHRIEERRRSEKNKDRFHAIKVTIIGSILTALLTGILVFLGNLLIKVFD